MSVPVHPCHNSRNCVGLHMYVCEYHYLLCVGLELFQNSFVLLRGGNCKTDCLQPKKPKIKWTDCFCHRASFRSPITTFIILIIITICIEHSFLSFCVCYAPDLVGELTGIRVNSVSRWHHWFPRRYSQEGRARVDPGFVNADAILPHRTLIHS